MEKWVPRDNNFPSSRIKQDMELGFGFWDNSGRREGQTENGCVGGRGGLQSLQPRSRVGRCCGAVTGALQPGVGAQSSDLYLAARSELFHRHFTGHEVVKRWT